MIALPSSSSAVQGIFEDVENSPSVQASRIGIHAAFAGAATVEIQWRPDGANWRQLTNESGTAYAFTDSFSVIYEGPAVGLRLATTAHTADVTYSLIPY